MFSFGAFGVFGSLGTRCWRMRGKGGDCRSREREEKTQQKAKSAELFSAAKPTERKVRICKGLGRTANQRPLITCPGVSACAIAFFSSSFVVRQVPGRTVKVPHMSLLLSLLFSLLSLSLRNLHTVYRLLATATWICVLLPSPPTKRPLGAPSFKTSPFPKSTAGTYYLSPLSSLLS